MKVPKSGIDDAELLKDVLLIPSWGYESKHAGYCHILHKVFPSVENMGGIGCCWQSCVCDDDALAFGEQIGQHRCRQCSLCCI